MINNTKRDQTEFKKANNKIHRFIKKCLSNIPSDSKIFEVGSGDGDNALYIKKLGYDITPSDVSDDFIDIIKQKKLNPIKFNVLKDGFNDKYKAFLCWKVFVHFTKKDSLLALKKLYDALDDNGLVIFNLISRDSKEVDEECVDFPYPFSIGEKRYFKYYSKEEMDNIIKKTKFKIINYHEEVGIEKIKWLIYVLGKGEV